MELTGLPLTTSTRWFKNFQKVLTGDIDNIQEGVLRMFNFSDYVIEGKGSKKKSKPFKQKKKKFFSIF